MPYADAHHRADQHPHTGRQDRALRAARRARGTGASRSARPPPRRARAPGSRGRAAGPRRSRPTSGRARSTASAGTRRARGGSPPSHAKRSSCSSACPNGVAPSRARASTAYGTPSAPSTVSSGARQRVERGRDERDLLGRRPGAEELEQLVADELERAARARSLEEAHRTVERHGRRRRLLEERALEMRKRRVRDTRPSAAAAPRSLRRRAPTGPRRCARATRTRAGRARTAATPCTSARPASASSSAHSAPVRSSKPYAKTGSPCQASRSSWRRSHRTPALGVAVPEPEPVELGAVRGVQERQLAVEVARARAGRTRARRACWSSASAKPAVRAERASPFERNGGERAPHDQRRAGPRRRRGARRIARREPARRGRRRCRSCRRAGSRNARAGRARPGRRPTGSARSERVRRRGAPDSARAGARPCPRSQARRGGRAPPSHRRAAAGRVPGRSRRVSSLRARRTPEPSAGARGGRRAARHLAGAVVAEIGHLRAAARVGIRDAERRALRLVDLACRSCRKPALFSEPNSPPERVGKSIVDGNHAAPYSE